MFLLLLPLLCLNFNLDVLRDVIFYLLLLFIRCHYGIFCRIVGVSGDCHEITRELECISELVVVFWDEGCGEGLVLL